MRTKLIFVLIVLLTAQSGQAAASDEPTLDKACIPWGLYPLQQGRWGQMHSVVANPTDQPVELVVATFYKDQPHLQYSSKAWTPPGALRRVVQPIIAPPCTDQRPSISADTTTLLLDAANGGERSFIRAPSVVTSQFYRNLIGVLADYAGDDPVFDVASANPGQPPGAATKKPNNTGRTIKRIRARGAPVYAEGWNLFDCVVIAQDHPVLGAAQIESLRNWLIGGGRVWIMLDQVDPAFVSRLLGDSYAATILERVKLNQFNLHDVFRLRDNPVDREEPVDMVRVDVTAGDVQFTVDGWPAVFTKDVGRGMVMFTTLGPRAWVDTEGRAGKVLQIIVRNILDRAAEPPITDDILRNYAQSFIGYRVLGRGPISWALMVFVALLAGAGLWMRSRNRMEYHALFAVGLSLVCTMLLLGMGAMRHGDIPSTVAMGQWIHIDPEQQYGVLRGASVMYAGQTLQPTIASSRGGLIIPDSVVRDQTEARLVFSDLNQWAWELPKHQPGVVQTATVSQTVALTEPVKVRVFFDEDQVTGKIQGGSFRDWTNPVLAVRRHHLVPTLTGPDTFKLDASAHQARDRFTAGAMAMTDTQARRQAIFKHVVYRPLQRSLDRYPLYPTLLAWAKPTALGLQYTAGVTHHDQALLSVPIEYVSPPPGTRVRIPPAMIPHQPDSGPSGDLKYRVYDETLDQWEQARNDSVIFMLRFNIPQALMPLKLEEARLELEVSAPKRSVELLDPHAVEHVILDKRFDVQGTTTFDLMRWPQFRPDERGGTLVRIRMGKSATPDLTDEQRKELRKEMARRRKEKKEGKYIPPKKLHWSMNGISLHVVGVVGDKNQLKDNAS